MNHRSCALDKRLNWRASTEYLRIKAGQVSGQWREGQNRGSRESMRDGVHFLSVEE